MLYEVLKDLDHWIQQENQLRTEAGMPFLTHATIQVLGQMAILEAHLSLTVASTLDVDAWINGEQAIKEQFSKLLAQKNLTWDPLSEEIWMPKETKFIPLYQGKRLTGLLAKPEFVLISKALKAPAKNKILITEYLASGPSPLFFKLTKKYQIDLGAFV